MVSDSNMNYLPFLISACWEFVFGDKIDVFFSPKDKFPTSSK